MEIKVKTLKCVQADDGDYYGDASGKKDEEKVDDKKDDPISTEKGNHYFDKMF